MDKKFIDQVHHIVMSNITDEKFGVPKLASLLGLSQSQTLKKVRAETGKSVNQYIRELRLKKATKLIKKTDLTNAEISYKVGFSSQSYFNKTFRNRYGITPGEYKTQNVNLAELASKRSKNKIRNDLIIKKAFFVVSVILLFVVGYFIINATSTKIITRPNSIAVLPFRDMSPEDNQWFSDGISDNILTYLSQIKELTAISFTSSSTYRNTNKKIPEIAKELGVSYILEGSVTIYDDKIKINTQLINANDEHVWSEDYTIAFEDIITIQQTVSKQIVKELELTLSPKEVAALEKYPTQNMEAYHLFLKGRLINDSRKVGHLELNIELNKQAIALDPNFAGAYAEIARSYYLMRIYSDIDDKECDKKATVYVEKALKIDPNCFRAIAVKAMLLWRNDWAKAKEYHEKAIALNPNDAAAHLQYGRYFLFCPNPDLNKFLYYLRIAQRLNPFSSVVGHNFFNSLILNNKIDEAEEYYKKMGFLYQKEEKLWKEIRIIAHKKKDWTEAIRYFEQEIEKDPKNSVPYMYLGNLVYNEILNDDINFLKYARKAYELDSTKFYNTQFYFNALVENGKFNDAKNFLQNKNFKSIISEKKQLSCLWYYYYHQENYKKAHDVLSDSLMNDTYILKSINYAQLADTKCIDSLFKNYIFYDSDKALVYAILKEKDSMYHYLEKTSINRTGRGPNSRKEFDPYRKEERYKAFLRKNYLPITHWNE